MSQIPPGLEALTVYRHDPGALCGSSDQLGRSRTSFTALPLPLFHHTAEHHHVLNSDIFIAIIQELVKLDRVELIWVVQNILLELE